MTKYLVVYEDMDAWPVLANTRGQAKRFYCDMMGLGRDGFAIPGFSIRKMDKKTCGLCRSLFDGTSSQTLCPKCRAELPSLFRKV